MIDLRELLDERSADPPGLDGLRIAHVNRRLTHRRRRRITLVASTAAVVLLLFGGYHFLPTLRTAPNPDPAATPSSSPSLIHGFPEYQHGRRLVAATSAPVTDRELELTWTPANEQFDIQFSCDDLQPEVHIRLETALAGRSNATHSCHSTLFLTLATAGLKLGEPATLKVTQTGAFTPLPEGRITPLPQPSIGTVRVAIWEPVDFADYPLPPRPPQLAELPELMTCAEREAKRPAPDDYLRADPSNPNAPGSRTFVWQGEFSYLASASTPGKLRLSINGTQVEETTWWRYDAGIHLGHDRDTADDADWKDLPGWVQPRQGELVTITVTPEHMTGPWHLRITEANDGRWCS